MIDRPDRKNFFLKKTRPNTALVFCEQEEAGLGVREGRYHFEEREKNKSAREKRKQVCELGKNVLRQPKFRDKKQASTLVLWTK